MWNGISRFHFVVPCCNRQLSYANAFTATNASRMKISPFPERWKVVLDIGSPISQFLRQNISCDFLQAGIHRHLASIARFVEQNRGTILRWHKMHLMRNLDLYQVSPIISSCYKLKFLHQSATFEFWTPDCTVLSSFMRGLNYILLGAVRAAAYFPERVWQDKLTSEELLNRMAIL